MSDPVIHYSGALAWRISRNRVRCTSAGFPSCVSGMRAVKIAERGEQTRVVANVTCPRCLDNIERTREYVAEESGS